MSFFYGSMAWLIAILILDLIFLGVVFGGVKLAGYGRRVFGLIVLVSGLAILTLGIWHQIDQPPIDLDSDHPDERFRAHPILHGIVFICGGVCLLAGLLLTHWSRSKTQTTGSARAE